MRAAFCLLPAILIASPSFGGEVSFEKANEAIAFLLELSKVCLDYGLDDDKFPLGQSPLGIDWLREAKSLDRLQKAIVLRSWRSKNSRWSVEAAYVSSTQDTITLRTDKGKVGTVPASKLDATSTATLSFIRSYGEKAITLADAARAQLDEQKLAANPVGGKVFGVLWTFCDADYLRSIAFDEAAAEAATLDKLLQQLTSDEQKAIWHATTIRLTGLPSQTKLMVMGALKHAPAELMLTIKAEEDDFHRAADAHDRTTTRAIQERRRLAGIAFHERLFPMEYSNARHIVASLSKVLISAAKSRLDSRKHPQPLKIEALDDHSLRALQVAQRREVSKQELAAVKSYVEAHFAKDERGAASVRLCADIIRTHRYLREVAAQRAERGEFGEKLDRPRRPAKERPITVDVGSVAGELAEFRALFDVELADPALE